jgi:hypothetical protein
MMQPGQSRSLAGMASEEYVEAAYMGRLAIRDIDEAAGPSEAEELEADEAAGPSEAEELKEEADEAAGPSEAEHEEDGETAYIKLLVRFRDMKEEDIA